MAPRFTRASGRNVLFFRISEALHLLLMVVSNVLAQIQKDKELANRFCCPRKKPSKPANGHLLLRRTDREGLVLQSSRTVPVGALAPRAYGRFAVKPRNPFVSAPLATVAHHCNWSLGHYLGRLPISNILRSAHPVHGIYLCSNIFTRLDVSGTEDPIVQTPNWTRPPRGQCQVTLHRSPCPPPQPIQQRKENFT